jgi:phosphoglycolate phosphatase
MTVYNGIRELLRYLDENSIPFAVDTNKDEDVSKTIINRFFPDFSFSCVEGNRPGIPRKPDPARANMIIARLGILSEECVYMGDSEVDIMTAKNAGMASASAAWGFRKIEELISAGAVHIMNKPTDLIGLIENINSRQS